MPDETSSVNEFDKSTAKSRKVKLDKLNNVAFTPLEGQVAFIKELIKKPDEAQKFLSDPKTYSVEHGVLLHPNVVAKTVNQTLFDINLDVEFAEEAGIHVTKDIIDIRNRFENKPPTNLGGPVIGEGPGLAAAAAVVAAAAAVVVAAATVVTMVVTLVRAGRAADLYELQGLGKGTFLPGPIKFHDRTGIRDVTRLRSINRGAFMR